MREEEEPEGGWGKNEMKKKQIRSRSTRLKIQSGEGGRRPITRSLMNGRGGEEKKCLHRFQCKDASSEKMRTSGAMLDNPPSQGRSTNLVLFDVLKHFLKTRGGK